MNTNRLLADIKGGTWMMHEPAFLAMAENASRHDAGVPEAAAKRTAMDNLYGLKDPPPIAAMDKGVLVAGLSGVMYPGLGIIGRTLGYIDPDDIADELQEKEDDADAVLLVIDSPGGAVSRTPDLANVVREIASRKPVIVYASGLCCSAAYWVASQASAIYASPSSHVGSIGVFQAIADMTGAYDKAGVKVELFKSGALKGANAYGTSLTDEQRAAFQSNIDTIFSEFKGAVTYRRPQVKTDAMTGWAYYGASAKPLGLVDSISDLNTAKADLRKIADLRRMKG